MNGLAVVTLLLALAHIGLAIAARKDRVVRNVSVLAALVYLSLHALNVWAVQS